MEIVNDLHICSEIFNSQILMYSDAKCISKPHLIFEKNISEIEDQTSIEFTIDLSSKEEKEEEYFFDFLIFWFDFGTNDKFLEIYEPHYAYKGVVRQLQRNIIKDKKISTSCEFSFEDELFQME